MQKRSKIESTAVLPPLPTSATSTYVDGEDPSRLRDAAACFGLLLARQPTAGVCEAAALLLKAAAVERERIVGDNDQRKGKDFQIVASNEILAFSLYLLGVLLVLALSPQHSNEVLANDESKTEGPVPQNNLMDLFAPAATYSERTQCITKGKSNQRLRKEYECKVEEKIKVLEAKVYKLEDTIEKMTKTHAESITSLEAALNNMQAMIVELRSNRLRELDESRAKGFTITI
eukprot:CAMPEP_0197449564 /NCGR_PEP_ID=MMETSP1175-20131217/22070_1 /TAXON_ID=1003142 /ORGANISM="Triceratium dubium, Strain CCMP147" /LENGTH=231 /DNA_ID=CAMNT_0042981727 /DNA_START=84 /DNA_END=776 /DNA_ORIENTATION=+